MKRLAQRWMAEQKRKDYERYPMTVRHSDGTVTVLKIAR